MHGRLHFTCPSAGGHVDLWVGSALWLVRVVLLTDVAALTLSASLLSLFITALKWGCWVTWGLCAPRV